MEYNCLKKEEAELERAFLMYKNAKAPQLLQEKDKERMEQFKYKIELINKLKEVKAELQEKNSKKAKLLLEAGLLQLELTNLNAELDNLKSKEHEKLPVKYEKVGNIRNLQIKIFLIMKSTTNLVYYFFIRKPKWKGRRFRRS